MAESESLSEHQLKELLRRGDVAFGVTDVDQVAWVGPEDSFRFWKAEVRPHLAKPEEQVRLEDWPDGYCYFATTGRASLRGRRRLLRSCGW